MNRLKLRLSLVMVLAVGCGSDESSGSDGNVSRDGGTHDGATNGSDGGVAEFADLVTASWSLAKGKEGYWCARKTLTEDVYIGGFKDISPDGTHHTVLSMGPPEQADGEFECDAGENRTQMLFASGVGSDPFEFPQGVAMKVEKGQQLNLNLHLYNVTDFEINATSGVQVRKVAKEDLVHEAQMVFAGTFLLDIPSQPGTSKFSGYCTMKQDATIINLWPHMHQLGVHSKVSLGDQVLLDEPYTFEEQKNYPTELSVKAGDKLSVECSYRNSTGSSVQWGDSSDDEMCFVGFMRYPVSNEGLFCVTGDGFDPG